ncbi:MAG: CDGSH iron-sulfur domain-containing protein [Legionellaceae bacterium]|nr:CDGSH iron-sulfur domain-containing protein [Legionellaceae bacterium]
MKEPIIADNKPAKVSLTPGDSYYFCTCGRSENQPFCDGSHKGTKFTPQSFVAEKEEAYLCQCKQSSNKPYCDGAHRSIKEEQIGKSLANAKSVNIAKSTPEEPYVELIHQLAKDGLKTFGHHGPMTAMGVPRTLLPSWDNIQILVAQLARQPLMEDVRVDTRLVIGPKAKKPLTLEIPLFVSDMSFGSLSEEAKIALAKGAELSGTGICSGEGGMLPEEQDESSRYFYELASAMFGYDESILTKVQAFHFKGGQAAKTGTGGHLPANKNTAKIASVRKISEGQPAVSPPTFKELHTVKDFKRFSDRVREISGGIPIGFKLSANHIEKDIQFALDAGVDYIILDGRGGGTGAAPVIFRDHISVPTIPALARARRYLNKQNKRGEITLIITGGLRTPMDFVKAMALGADGIAIANSAIQAIGCIGARMCNTNLCPAGIATQDPNLRKQIDIDVAAKRLNNFLTATINLMSVMARACGYDALSKFNRSDLTTFDGNIAKLADIEYGGCQEY